MNRVLRSREVDKPWGRSSLPHPFNQPQAGARIGEIWFEPPVEMPELLVKYIFTDERLSVQVHPDDQYARSNGEGTRGKEECWLVISAETDAVLGIGFNSTMDPGQIKSAALSGEIVENLTWHPVRPGDFFYIPAGTVHAIGAGVGLIEVQQNSDITYRLFDYGRPRELHLTQGTAVANGAPYDTAWSKRTCMKAAISLTDGPHFRLDQLVGPPDSHVRARYGDRPLLVIPRNEPVNAGSVLIGVGACGLAASLEELDIGHGVCCLIAQPCQTSGLTE